MTITGLFLKRLEHVEHRDASFANEATRRSSCKQFHKSGRRQVKKPGVVGRKKEAKLLHAGAFALSKPLHPALHGSEAKALAVVLLQAFGARRCAEDSHRATV